MDLRLYAGSGLEYISPTAGASNSHYFTQSFSLPHRHDHGSRGKISSPSRPPSSDDRINTECHLRTVSPLQVTKGHISCLFPEILTMIFSYLEVRDKGRVACVCHLWKEAAYNRRVWMGVEAKLHLRKITPPSLFPSLVQRGIKCVQVVSVKRNQLSELVDSVHGLQSLNLSGCYNITDEVMGHALCHDFPSLVSLNLSLCKHITDSTIACIAGHVKSLEALYLGGCSQITSNGLLLLACGLSNLRTLNLRSCCKITDEGLAHLTGQSAVSVRGLALLEELVLQDCQKITDLSLKHISLGLSHLRSLSLSFCSGVTDSGLECLSRVRTLQELDLQACDGISDHGIGFLADGGSRLTSLHVSFCDRITDTALLHVSQGLFHLTVLSLCDCAISDEGIRHLVSTSHDLIKLNIGQCARITDASLQLISQHLGRLKDIDLYGCTRISQAGIRFLRAMPSLLHINTQLAQPK